MSNENWEEISEWDIEEDVDLAQRITVHTVHSINNGVEEEEEEEYELIQAHKQPTYAAAAKWGGRKPRKEYGSDNDKADNITAKTSPKKKKSSSSSTSLKDDNKSADTISKDDHDVDYDSLDPTTSKKETRRSNTKLHKIHSHKLMSSLVPDGECELNQNLVRGDTNRDPEYKKYKLLKKTLESNKKGTKMNRKGEKFRVEIF